MRILIDTNILLDYLVGRKPHYDAADQLLRLCAERRVQGFMAAHSIPNMFYILRKDMSEHDRREVLLRLCRILKVEGIDQVKIISALNQKNFSDFEDCLQVECAVAVQADYIVTRNEKDFLAGDVACISAEELCKKIMEE
ncbi:MAG: PIN domain-containing protein [Lachnospiraceae bacterium]|nr:PIN domain-containing protein [Lachnospiraceae bacterium]